MAERLIRGRKESDVRAYDVLKGIILLSLVGTFLMVACVPKAEDHGDGHGGESHSAVTHNDTSHAADDHGDDHATDEHADDHATEDMQTAPPLAPAAGKITFDELKSGDRVPPGPTTIKGMASPNAELIIRRGQEVVGNPQADAEGHWAYMVVLNEGPIELTVEHAGMPAEVLKLTVVPPVEEIALTVTNPANGSNLSHGDPLTLRGTARPGDLVRVDRNGERLAEVKADEEGNWEFPTVHREGSSYTATSLGDGATETVGTR